MSFSWQTSTLLAVDQDFTVPVPVAIPEPSSPIPAKPDTYLFTQDWMQFLANWTPGTYNQLHPDFSSLNGSYSGPDFFLVAEGPRRSVGGGVVKWTRTYAAKPATHDEPETFANNWIGFMGLWRFNAGFLSLTNPIVVAVSGRPRFNRSVNTRLHHDYFLIGITDHTAAVAAGQATADYLVGEKVPAFTQQLYFAGEDAGTRLFYTDSLSDGTVSLINGSLTSATTVPSLTDYSTWITNAQTYGWAGGIATAPDGTQYVLSSPGANQTALPAWSSAGVYHTYDVVSDSAVGYACIADVGPSGTHPASDATHWGPWHPSQIVVEESRLSRWQGNVFLRQSRYALAI
jgi:hypothetical protein